MQTILGAGGAIGTNLAKELTRYTTRIRLVGRNPKPVNDTDELVSANLMNKAALAKAVAGSEVVYLVAGLTYKAKVWEAQWPVIMRNVIDACKQYKSKLVFFDNMYMYDPEHLNRMTEATPVRPVSRKGAVRAQIAQMLLDEINGSSLQAMIVRAADFLGTHNSVIFEMVAKNLAKGKKANWMVDADKIHSFTYVPDAAKATALLGNTPDAYRQVWHLPTDDGQLTGRQWVQLFAQEQGKAPKLSVLSKGMMGVLGIFIPVLREFKEMAYQYEKDYYFDSSKFTQRFGLSATPPQEAIKEIVDSMKKA